MEKMPFYIDVVQHKNDIVCWFRDYDGELYKDEVPAENYCYGYVNTQKESPNTDIYGNYVKRISFDNSYEKMKYLKDHEDVSHEMDVPEITRFMIDEFKDADIESPYNVGYYDIEVDYDLEDNLGHPLPTNPFGEISCIQFFDVSRKQYVMFIPYQYREKIKLKDKHYPVKIYYTVDERDLLNQFAEYIDHIDVLGGWFTDGYDLPYIMERAIKLFGEKKALTMFCRDGFKATKREFNDDYGNDTWEWTLKGRQHVDMMKLFKKFIPGERESYSLDAVCEEYLGEKKVKYEGDLGELLRRDPQTYFEYALHDARLLLGLDNKLDIISLAVTMSRKACTHIKDTTATVKPIENSFIKFCQEKNKVLPNKIEHEKESYEGAIVYNTRSGLFKWSSSFDLTSLYPSVMIMLGLSTETLVAQCKNGYDDFVEVVSQTEKEVTIIPNNSDEPITAPAHDIWDMIVDSGYVISANGTMFDGTLGLLSEFVKSIFDERVTQKQISKDAFKRGDEEEGKRYDLFQKVTKIFANSLYGCIANEYFRLFDIRMARSITITGQMISKQQAVAAEQILGEYEQ